MRIAVFWLAITISVLLSGCAPKVDHMSDQIDMKSSSVDIDETIRDPNAPDDVVFQKILETRKELPARKHCQLWADVANDNAASDPRRRWAVLQLFDTCIEPGMTLAEAGKVLSGAQWLDKNQMYWFFYLAGWIPIKLHPDESPMDIVYNSPSGCAILLSLAVKESDHPPMEKIYEALSGVQNESANIRIAQIAISLDIANDHLIITNPYNAGDAWRSTRELNWNPHAVDKKN